MGCRAEQERQEKVEQLAKDLVDEFEQEWEPIMENVKEANDAFDNLDGGVLRRTFGGSRCWALQRHA